MEVWKALGGHQVRDKALGGHHVRGRAWFVRMYVEIIREFSKWIINHTGGRTILYLTCSTITLTDISRERFGYLGLVLQIHFESQYQQTDGKAHCIY